MITADGLAKEYRKWRVLFRVRRSGHTSIVVYKKWGEEHYKVQVFGRDADIWAEFSSLEHVKDFLGGLKGKYFFQGRMLEEDDFYKESARVARFFHTSRFNERYPKGFQKMVCEALLMGGSCYAIGKKLGVRPEDIRKIALNNNLKFVGNNPKAGGWVKSD